MKLTKQNKKYYYFFKQFPSFYYQRGCHNTRFPRSKDGTKVLKKLLQTKGITIHSIYSNKGAGYNMNCNSLFKKYYCIRFNILIKNTPCCIEYTSTDILVHIGIVDFYNSIFGTDDYVQYNSSTDFFGYRKGDTIAVLNDIDILDLTEEQEFQYSTLIDNLELYKEVKRFCNVASTENITWSKLCANI